MRQWIGKWLLAGVDVLLCLGFLVCIGLPLIVAIVEDDDQSSELERRNLAQLPARPASLQELQQLPQRLENYYADQFGFRNELLGVHFSLSNLLMTDSTAKNLTAGKDGWLFLGSIKPGYAGYSDPMGDAMNINLYSSEQLAAFAAYLTAIRDWLALRGIQYVYVITPNKHSIYPDKLPDYLKKRNPESAVDQLVRHLREHTDVVVVDLRQALLAERELHEVYYRLDSHWNSYGANVAQYEIMKAVAQFFPDEVQPYRLSDEEFVTVDVLYGDLAGMAGMVGASEPGPQPVFSGRCEPVRVAENADFFAPFTTSCDGEDLNVLIFRDSFFTALVPYISRQFERTTFVWSVLNQADLEKYIEREAPVLVIDQLVERVHPYLPAGQPFVDELQRLR